MRRLGLFAALGLAAACSSSNNNNQASLIISANPRAIDDQGGTTQVTVNAVAANGDAGTATVSLTSGAGDLSNGSGTATTVTLDSTGTAVTTFSCDVRKDTKCSGKVKLTGTWTGLTSNLLTITVGSADAGGGTPDAGGGGQDSGTYTDAGNGMGNGNGTVLSLSSSQTVVVVGIGGPATLTAHLQSDAGTALSGQPIVFNTTLGTVGPVGGATVGPSFSSNTNAAGDAQADLSAPVPPVQGEAVVSATHAASGAVATLGIPIVQVRQVSWISTQCGGKDCNIMGLRGTGFNEQAQVTFRVIDVENNVVGGIPVNFKITNPPGGSGDGGTTVSPNGITDAMGDVIANVSSGAVVGVFAVTAVVIPGQIQTQSPSIGIVGVKPTNATFGFQCDTVNIPAYIGTQRPRPAKATCHVGLSDRFGNPIGTGTSVFFKPEAGLLPNSVPTGAFDPTMADNTNQGMGTVTFQTGPGGVFPAADVLPLPALTAAQQPFPGPRAAEPSVTTSNGVVHNPRDGLVTLLAYVKGEEWFLDKNNNGVYDVGEPFIDQGEPFVDSNDNGICDPDEFFVDVNNNGIWDGPNGVWDGDTDVWTVAYVIYSGNPVAPGPCPGDPYCGYLAVSPTPFAPLCPGGVPHFGNVPLVILAPDQNLNRVWGGSTFSATTDPTGLMAPPFGVFCGQTFSICNNIGTLDSFGMSFQRVLLNSADQTECLLGQTPVCVWQTVFQGWELGNLHAEATVLGQTTSPFVMCTDIAITVAVSSDVSSAAVTSTAGGIQ